MALAVDNIPRNERHTNPVQSAADVNQHSVQVHLPSVLVDPGITQPRTTTPAIVRVTADDAQHGYCNAAGDPFNHTGGCRPSLIHRRKDTQIEPARCSCLTYSPAAAMELARLLIVRAVTAASRM